MPSLEESRRQVRDGLAREIDHDAILANLHDEMDEHNDRHSHRDTSRKDRSMRFRFKGDKRKHPYDEDDTSYHHQRRGKRRKHTPSRDEAPAEEEASHPFPREPVSLSASPEHPFLDSLLDALASDEGAEYWQSVYSEPIHIYPRPATPTSEEGSKDKLSRMTDDEYAEYVKLKMWERKNPEIVRERRKKEMERKREEEERTRNREDFIRRKERAAWERAERAWTRKERRGSREEAEGEEYEFTGHGNQPPNGARTAEEATYTQAWKLYISAWESLTSTQPPRLPEVLSHGLPYPVVTGQQPTKQHISTFFYHAPKFEQAKSKLHLLKAERVKWHPDKFLQRFGGTGTGLDEATLKKVTAVFQVIDGLVEEERKTGGL